MKEFFREIREVDNIESEENTDRKLPEHFQSTYQLRQNERYEAREYDYETDRFGRIVHCEGTLRLEEGKVNPVHQRNAGGESRLDTDDGGHLIARRFGGSERIDNLVPMDYHLNRGEYKHMENEWAEALAEGYSVEVKIKCNYTNDSFRPDSFSVYYRVTDMAGTIIEHGKRRFMNEE